MNIPNSATKHCVHTHLSGRECGQRVRPSREFCGLHQGFDSRGGTVCKECADMLAVFPIRKNSEGE